MVITSTLYYLSTLCILLPLYIISPLYGNYFLSILFLHSMEITSTLYDLFALWILLPLYIISLLYRILLPLYIISLRTVGILFKLMFFIFSMVITSTLYHFSTLWTGLPLNIIYLLWILLPLNIISLLYGYYFHCT